MTKLVPNLKIVLAVCTMSAAFCQAKEPPPAWVNAIDTNAMARLLCDYTNNVIRSEWAGEDATIEEHLPVNIGFGFVVIGDEDVTNRVNAILRSTRESIPPAILSEIEKHHYLCPVLQWLVRSTRQGVTNATSYLDVNAAKAVFKEADFNLVALTNIAANLGVSGIPQTAAIRQVFEVEPKRASIIPAEPGIDYPDVMPEQLFSCPYGMATVLRAPEMDRFFRYMVYNRSGASKIVWHAPFTIPMTGFRHNPACSMDKGFVDIRIGTHRSYRRFDVMVCQKYRDTYGPPTYISFYNIPYVKRKYDKRLRIQSVEYGYNGRKPPPYDISPIYIPRYWTDDYECRQNDIVSYIRSFPVGLSYHRPEEFSGRGELVTEMDFSNRPVKVRKVRYYVENGELKYEPYGEEIDVRKRPPRRRGEDCSGWER